MAYKIREYKRKGVVKGWEVDITLELPNGDDFRERKKSPVTSKSGTERWAQAREREILTGKLEPRKLTADAPKLSVFWPRFLRDHVRASGHKPSGIESKEYGYRQFLEPWFGELKLDEITAEKVSKLKSWMLGDPDADAPPSSTRPQMQMQRRKLKLKAGTVNNTLALLSKVLNAAKEWGVIAKMPCRIVKMKTQTPHPEFYDFEEFERIVTAARALGSSHYLTVLLGGDAGLRRGEIIALEQKHCDTRLQQLRLELSEWNGHLTETKGMEARVVPMTDRLAEAIKAHRHLRGARLLIGERGGKASKNTLRGWAAQTQRAAGISKTTGALHVLRHTFCSHLAMRGVPATVIQKLAGHKSLVTTLRYMHLAEGETDRAIRLLGRGGAGDILETAKNHEKVPGKTA